MTQPTDSQPDNLLGEFAPTSYTEWKAAAEQLLKGKPFDKVMLTKTPESITLKPIYRAEDVADLESRKGVPGLGDHARGATASGYLNQPWDIAQELPYGTPETFNDALKNDLMRGQNAINVSLDIATQRGKDPDRAGPGEVGACGVSLACIKDFETAFDGIIPEAVAFYFQNSTSGLPVAALLVGWLHRHGHLPSVLRGGLNFDPLATLAASGSVSVTLDQLYDEMAALVQYHSVNSPQFAAVGISGQPYGNAGASAVEELACALATGVEYIRQLQARGIDIDSAASQLLFTFTLGPNFFMEIAKLRAARLLWAQVVTAFGGQPQSCAMRIHGRTTLWNKTRHDPYVNMLRTTTEALSGAIGGVQSMHVGTFDEILRLPDTFSRRIARNTQVILQEECELTGVIDPAGGSWYIEHLTDELAGKAWESFQTIEKEGGMSAALTSGFIQEMIATTRTDRLKFIGQRRQGLVGTNLFPNLSEIPLPANIPNYDSIRVDRSKELSEYRISNNEDDDWKVMQTLTKLTEKEAKLNLAVLIDAANAGATLGEITSSVRANAQEPLTIVPLPSCRAAEPYEALRRASANFKTNYGKAPRIYLANVGPLKRHKLRMDFITGFFQTGGFELLPGDGTNEPQEAVKQASESMAPIVVICGSDDDYPNFVPTFCKALKTLSPSVTIALAGDPGEHKDTYTEAGLDDNLTARSPNLETNKRYLSQLGVL